MNYVSTNVGLCYVLNPAIKSSGWTHKHTHKKTHTQTERERERGRERKRERERAREREVQVQYISELIITSRGTISDNELHVRVSYYIIR